MTQLGFASRGIVIAALIARIPFGFGIQGAVIVESATLSLLTCQLTGYMKACLCYDLALTCGSSGAEPLCTVVLVIVASRTCFQRRHVEAVDALR